MSQQDILSQIEKEIAKTEKYLNKLHRAAAPFRKDAKPKKPIVRHRIDVSAAQAEVLRVIQEQQEPWTVYEIFAKVNQEIVSNPQFIYRMTDRVDIHMVGKRNRAVTYLYRGKQIQEDATKRRVPKRKGKKINPKGYVTHVIEDVVRRNGSMTRKQILPRVNAKIREDGRLEITDRNLASQIQRMVKAKKLERVGRATEPVKHGGIAPSLYGVPEVQIRPGEGISRSGISRPYVG
jgi:hypothetical protein